MTLTTFYYGPTVSKINKIYSTSENIMFDKKYGLLQYTSKKTYLKENMFTWKFPKSEYIAIKKEKYNIRLCIITLTGSSISLTISSEDTVKDIKEKLFDKEGIPTDQQRLVYNGISMNDSFSCINFFEKIDDIYRIHMILTLRGGMMHPSSGKGDNFNKSRLKIEMSSNNNYIINFNDYISSEIVKKLINEYLDSLEGIVNTFNQIASFENFKFKHILMSEDKLRKDKRIIKMMELSENEYKSEWVDVITKLQILLLKKYGFDKNDLSEYQASSQKHPNCCFWVRENKSGPCNFKISKILPTIIVNDLNNNPINLKDESKDPLVVITGSIS